MLNPINDPFALTLYSPFLTEMRIALGALDILSRAYLGRRKVFLVHLSLKVVKNNHRFTENSIIISDKLNMLRFYNSVGFLKESVISDSISKFFGVSKMKRLEDALH